MRRDQCEEILSACKAIHAAIYGHDGSKYFPGSCEDHLIVVEALAKIRNIAQGPVVHEVNESAGPKLDLANLQIEYARAIKENKNCALENSSLRNELEIFVKVTGEVFDKLIDKLASSGRS